MGSLILLARGREADVFDRGDGTVLRRYRDQPVSAREVDVMRYLRARGYPVPEVVAVNGSDLILNRVVGPTMMDALAADPTSLAHHAAQLAELHHRLHRIAAPDWLPARGDGDRILHLDLHPQNVLLTTSGPVVIDWPNAARGPAALDPAKAIAVFISALANADARSRTAILAFTRAFAAQFDAADLRGALPLGFELRRADGRVTDAERAALRAFTLSDIGL
jgi:tRNA A-37 threonylcarbamoyl transferase component Bud32